MVGNDVLFWSELGMFCTIVTQHDILQYLRASTPESSFAHSCRRVTEIEGLHSTVNLMSEVLVSGRDSKATIARDKVYAVLGICVDKLDPDYSSSVTDHDVFVAASLRIFRQDPIALCCCVDHERPDPVLPSWVPDWSVPRVTQSIGYYSTSQAVYDAALGSEWDCRLGSNSRVVHALAKNFDIVMDCLSSGNEALVFADAAELELESCPTFLALDGVRTFALQSQLYPSGSTLFEATWMTLVAGSDESAMQPAPAAYANVFGLLFDSAVGTSPSFPDQPTPERRLTLKNLEVRRPAQLYREIRVATARALTNRRIGRTEKGYLGVMPRGAQHGDRVVVLHGGHVPFVIRPYGPDAYQLIGECYVHGIMKGEVMKMQDVPSETITLV